MVEREHRLAEASENDFFELRMRANVARRRADGDLDRVFQRVAIDAAADGGKRDGPNAMSKRKLEAGAITRLEQLRLAAGAPAPYRAYRMDHMLGRQLVAAGN